MAKLENLAPGLPLLRSDGTAAVVDLQRRAMASSVGAQPFRATRRRVSPSLGDRRPITGDDWCLLLVISSPSQNKLEGAQPRGRALTIRRRRACPRTGHRR